MCSKRRKPGSPLVHEQHRPAKAFADLAHVKAGQQSNICYHFKLRTGDVDKAFAEADRVFEDTFSSPPAQHMPMEPHVTLAYVDEHERLNIWTASQSPSYVRTEISATFGIPMNRIRVRVPYIGGGYGAKLYAKLEPLVHRAGADHEKAGALRADARRRVFDDHQAQSRYQDQNGDQRRRDHGAQMRSLLGHRRLRGNRPAHRSQVRLHIGGAVSHSQRVDRFLLRVHEQSARGCVPRFRCAASYLGL